MRLREFLTEVAEDNKVLWGIKHIAETDQLQIKEFPAIVITEDPYDYSEQGVFAAPGSMIQSCTVFVILLQKGANDLTRAAFVEVRDQLADITLKYVKACKDAMRSANGIANISFDKGTPDFMQIDARTCDVMTLPVKGFVSIDN